MATRTWLGQATPVAQVSQAQITTFDAATTYAVLIGDEIIASAQAADVTSVINALVAAWAASEHPYKTNLVAALLSTDTLQITSQDPGHPFLATVSVTGGTGAWGAVTDTTPVESPNDWANAANWAEGAVPISGDTPVLRDGSVDIRWGLDQAAVALARLAVEQSYTGRIGLSRTQFMTDSTGATTALKPEYRPQYLAIGITRLDVGEILGPAAPAGSDRVKIDNRLVGPSTTVIHNSSAASADGDLPAVRLLAADAAATLEIRSATGGLGVAVDGPGETSQLSSIEITDQTPGTRVSTGAGLVLGAWNQRGGVNALRATGTVGAVDVLDGQLDIEGACVVTNLQVLAGTCRPHNVPAAGDAITDVSIWGGTVDGQASRLKRTWAAVNLNDEGATLRIDSQAVTVTSLKAPVGPYGLTVV